ncbi:hypothetical protein HYH38_16305 [Clostridium botulinum]|uniref:Putative PspC-like cell wall binding protein n=2 Tax=Clostridium botulinum TaxID=1491 RepID=A0A126JI79_CLOBO|nr:hypothetical protein [Clostridium botulinum]ALT05420.1 putative PspC-like cell wall binding protein [Clostridium botulinum]ALT05518.1 putative PspC-like cell wall binding protein [Clostridium botulinum]ALT05616.1 putative PspC-like cell wall binding protein [Clostridium botulinum]ALT05716.1 putative PspC-like cell wall binding protein [Clostridium botulinum]ALT05818.1 putative PspC-like cell wall binding protein [Clostridium botulinum]
MKRNKIIIMVATITTLATLLPGEKAVAKTNNLSMPAITQRSNEVNQYNDEIMSIKKSEVTTTSSVNIENPTTINFDEEIYKVNKILSDFKGNNNTTKEEIINLIRANIDSNINISFKDKEQFSKVYATKKSNGRIKGTLIFNYLNESKEISINLSIERLEEFKDDIVTTLKAKIIGLDSNNNLNIGKTTSVKVTGYNLNNEEVILDENKLKYEWFADGKLVGMKKELKITGNMDEKFITCEVEYPDEENGGF